jgi:hypothetical protein
MADTEDPVGHDPAWLGRFRKTGFYVVAVFVGVVIAEIGNVADVIGKSWDRLKKPEAFVLAEATAKSQFSDQFAQRAWRRLFWADNFRARVVNEAPIGDIDSSWKAYIETDADWNANVMISIVGVDRYYGQARSAQLESEILPAFARLDDNLAVLRRSAAINAIREGKELTADQRSQVAGMATSAKNASDDLKVLLYVFVRCFAPGKNDENQCVK